MSQKKLHIIQDINTGEIFIGLSGRGVKNPREIIRQEVDNLRECEEDLRRRFHKYKTSRGKKWFKLPSSAIRELKEEFCVGLKTTEYYE